MLLSEDTIIRYLFSKVNSKEKKLNNFVTFYNLPALLAQVRIRHFLLVIRLLANSKLKLKRKQMLCWDEIIIYNIEHL